MRSSKKWYMLVLALLLTVTGFPFQSAVNAATADYVTVTKSVNPSSITTEEETEVTLSIKGTPPVNVVQPNDVILIIDKSGSMLPQNNNGEDKIQAAKDAAKGFIDLMDLTKHQVGIVDFSSQNVTRTFPLTTDAGAAKSYIDTINANGATATGYAIDQAIAELANHRPEAHPVIVIMTDGDATEPQNNPYQYAKDRAQAAKDEGIIFYTIALLKSTDNPDTSGPNLLLREMATTADHHHFVLGSQGLKDIYAAIVKEIGLASAYDVTVKDVVSPDFEIVPGSYDNNIPKPVVNGNTLTWEFNELKDKALNFTYRIKPKDPNKTGNLPVSTTSALITYKDYAGASKTKSIPNVNVQVKFPAPIITSIEKDFGHPNGGEPVTIKGDKFRTGATVKFGSTLATNVQVLNPNEITAVTPPGAQGVATVTVTNPDGQKATTEYRYKADPTVTSIEPNNGPLAGGNIVIFNGTFFINGISVKFGDQVAPLYTFASSTYFKVYAPAATAPGPVDIVVTNPDGTGVTIPGGYTYNKPPVDELVVTSINPNTGELVGGETVYIDGKKFASGIKVYFADKEALQTSFTETRVKVKAPAGDNPGPVDVKVVNPDGSSFVVKDGYTYKAAPILPAPEITSINPTSGLITGGDTITIQGNNFVQGLKVYFGTSEAQLKSFASSSKITVSSPAVQSAGIVDVKVVNPDNQEAIKPQGYSYLDQLPVPAPTITNISPNSGPIAGGTLVYIDGANFVQGVKAYFGTEQATVTSYTSTRLKVTSPAVTTDGQVDVKIVNPDGQEIIKPQGFTYLAPPPNPAPTITNVSPNSGPMAGGTLVYIDGANFVQGVKAYFGATQATVTSYTSTRLKVTSPAVTADGQVDVKIVNPDGQEIIKPQGFTYLAPPPAPAPTITNVNPNSGPIAGGTLVYIDGTNFAQGVKAFFGTTEGTVTSYTGTRLKVTSPAVTADGQVDVKIVNPDGQESIKPQGFTYIAPPPPSAPAITSISPSSGPMVGGTLVYIDGVNFVQGLTVYFGTTEATVTNYTSTRLKVTSPSVTVGGQVDVKIVNPDGQETSKAQGFTYLELTPEITNVSPNHGPLSGGTVVYVDGKDFDPNMTLTVDGKPVPISTYYGSTRFKFSTPSSTISGPVPIVVTVPSGKTASSTFTYDAPPPTPAPVITKINPTSGPVAGGTLIYVDGTGFVQGLKVYFNGVEGTVTSTTAARVKVKSPAAAAPGAVDIKIVNPDSQESNTIPFQYK